MSENLANAVLKVMLEIISFGKNVNESLISGRH